MIERTLIEVHFELDLFTQVGRVSISKITVHRRMTLSLPCLNGQHRLQATNCNCSILHHGRLAVQSNMIKRDSSKIPLAIVGTTSLRLWSRPLIKMPLSLCDPAACLIDSGVD